ncbi:hypothetical protein [Rhodococcus sp. O3]|uniref:hypothetical protein n=1 Tax=Rhodococcus sp. O3 TaxID=3404919 RepID=UPI003B6744DC
MQFHHMGSRFDTLDEYERALADYRARGVTIEVDGGSARKGGSSTPTPVIRSTTTRSTSTSTTRPCSS